MFGLGTVINTSLIIAGGLIGVCFKKAINERIKNSLLAVLGVCVIAIGLFGTFSAMEKLESDNPLLSNGTVIMILALVVGTVIGEALNIEKWFERFGEFLKRKTKSENDNDFLNAFLTASFTVSIGAMAVIGSINDGISGDYTLLLVKGILDFVFVMVMSSTLGKGCIFSAIPVFVLQGVMTIIAYFAGGFLPDNSIIYLSLVGNVMITCIGINLLFDRKIKVVNMLPAILIAVVVGVFI